MFPGIVRVRRAASLMTRPTLDLQPIDDAQDPRLGDYRRLKEQALRQDSGKFIAESEPVVRKLIASGLGVDSVLLTPHHLRRLEEVLPPGVPVYVAAQPVLDQVAGFHVHRGCLAVGRRPLAPRLPADARTVLVLEDLVDVDNLGGIARNAAAFGADGMMLSPRAADPYYRKAIRVSMGTVFSLSIVRAAAWPDELRALRDHHGLALVAAVLDDDAVPLSTFTWPERVALVLGAEGPGLAEATKRLCDHRVTIPMARERADSLNVATAAALFLFHRSGS
jgi:tRNA G18 (ribose-2'-O)-methylase SpoU